MHLISVVDQNQSRVTIFNFLVRIKVPRRKQLGRNIVLVQVLYFLVQVLVQALLVHKRLDQALGHQSL
jgi:hypothetical protein